MEDFKTQNNDIGPIIDFGPIEDKSKDIIKVIGVGGGGCNAVNNYLCRSKHRQQSPKKFSRYSKSTNW